MKTIIIVSALTSFALSCSGEHSGAVKGYQPGKGSAAFHSILAQGAGRLRPTSFKAGTALGLNAGAIVSTSLDDASGAWARVLFDTRSSDRLAADQDVLAFAQELLAKHSDELGFLPSEASAGSLYQPDPRTTIVSFQRLYHGVPVKGAFLRIFFAVQSDASLRLSEIINNSYGPIKVEPSSRNAPNDEEAIAATGIAQLAVTDRRLVIQPSIGSDGRYEFSYASEFKLKAHDGENFTITMDNDSRELREAYSNRVNEQQTITAEVFQRSYVLNDQVNKPLPFAQVIDGTTKLTTDADGVVDVNGKEVTIQLTSNKSAASVIDLAVSGSKAASFSATLDDGGKTNIKLSSVSPPAINVFLAVQTVVDFVGKYLSVDELPLLSSGIVAVVNRREDVCNAFYDSDSLNFFAQGKDSSGQTCANTGLISDVVYHEWGHALDDFLGPRNRSKGVSGITDGAYSEGIGDILSSYLVRAPNLGTGLYLNDPKELRNLQNTRKHPPANAAEAEIHQAGMIVGGAFWDMFTNLSALYGANKGAELATKLFLKHLQISERYLDAYAAVLRVDDDDNNPATPSPNYCNITRAFAAHNISGSEKADATCIDRDTSLNLRVDLDEGDGKLSLLASALGAAKIIACPGQVKSCKADTEGYIELAAVEADDALTLKGDRKYYTAKGSFDVKTNAAYSFFSLDSKNAIVGSKAMTFKSRADAVAAPKSVKT